MFIIQKEVRSANNHQHNNKKEVKFKQKEYLKQDQSKKIVQMTNGTENSLKNKNTNNFNPE